jgi:mRNA degradation ribonuclease J1/J2
MPADTGHVGNETAGYRVINGLTRLGARVVHKGSALVHVSGHAPAGELLYVLNLTKPRNFMPEHGEWRHLRAHARLASLAGVPDASIVIAAFDDAAFGDVLPKIEEALALAAADGITDAHQISQLARPIVGRRVSGNYRRRPMIIPVVAEV